MPRFRYDAPVFKAGRILLLCWLLLLSTCLGARAFMRPESCCTRDSASVIYGARYYDPQLGRFIQPDPTDSQSLNRYSYCRNNPLNATNPSGFDDGGGGRHGRAHGKQALKTGDGIEPSPVRREHFGRGVETALDRAGEKPGQRAGQYDRPGTL